MLCAASTSSKQSILGCLQTVTNFRVGLDTTYRSAFSVVELEVVHVVYVVFERTRNHAGLCTVPSGIRTGHLIRTPSVVKCFLPRRRKIEDDRQERNEMGIREENEMIDEKIHERD